MKLKLKIHSILIHYIVIKSDNEYLQFRNAKCALGNPCNVMFKKKKKKKEDSVDESKFNIL